MIKLSSLAKCIERYQAVCYIRAKRDGAEDWEVICEWVEDDGYACVLEDILRMTPRRVSTSESPEERAWWAYKLADKKGNFAAPHSLGRVCTKIQPRFSFALAQH